MTAHEASCGGCGETDPAKRCLGCLAEFGPAQQDSQQGAGGEVKPCPFCGSKDILEREIDTTGGPYVWFACMDCGAESSGDDGREDALDQWNRRSPSGHTGGPVAWQFMCGGEPMKAVWPYPDEAKDPWLSCSGADDQRPLYAAAQQDGGSGGGEAVARAAQKVSLWIKGGMPDQSDNTPTRDALKRDLETILSALQSVHPASGAEDVGLRTALERQTDNMAFALNRVSLGAWHHRFERELAEDRKLITPQDGAVAGEGGAG